jgi:hypothetical protein
MHQENISSSKKVIVTKYIRLNFATQGGGHNKPDFRQLVCITFTSNPLRRQTDAGGLFIGDLAPEVTDTLLLVSLWIL